MKKKITILVVIILILCLISGITNYIDGARVRTGVEPVCTIKIISEDGNKVTYWGVGYKVIRYPSVSPNEPFKNNKGVKMGNWFMKYEPKEYSIVNVYYENKEETKYPEKIYEDNAHIYYLPYYKSENIIAEDSDKVRINLKEAISKDKISIDRLEKEFGIKVIEEKKLLDSNEKSIANIPNIKFLNNETEEELTNILYGIPKNIIYDLWGEPTGKVAGWDYDYWNLENKEYPIIVSYDTNNNISGIINTLKVTHEEFCLISEDSKVLLNSEMSTLSKEPISELEGSGDGFHWKEYTYEDIFIKVLIGDRDLENIILISTVSDKYRTPRDIKVGDTMQKLQEKYSDDLEKANSDKVWYVYNPQNDLGFNRIYFYIENDIITKIVIENGIDG